MKVLIAIDDDQPSRDALSFAEELLPEDTQVLVLNVASYVLTPYVFPVYPFAMAAPAGTLDLDAHETADERARELVEREAGRFDYDAEVAVTHGDPASRICEIAEQEGVDLIVVGTRDRGTFGRLWFGSVSDHVTRNAPCPVLVVR